MNDDKKEQEYIEKAIELGATELWFTDHAPFEKNPFHFRMQMDELPEYVSTLHELKQKYAGKIDIKIGLEIEYLQNYYNYYENLKDSGNFDVFLLGQHFSWLPKEGIYTFETREKIAEPRELADGMIAGMQTGLFDVVAHPDQIFRRVKEWNDTAELISKEIKECAIKHDVILEKNISNIQGKKKKRVYRPEFWEDFAGRTIYGLDAHSVAELEENYRIQQDLEKEMK